MGNRSRFLEIIPNLLLFFLFAICMLMILFSGTRIYKSVSSVMEEQCSVSTCSSYVTAKIRHYDNRDAVSIGKIGETDAILLKERIQDEAYVTYLYCYDGTLMELFCIESMQVDPSDGQSIMPLDDFICSMENGVLSFCCKADDRNVESAVYLQSDKGAFS